ncbi:VWA domain-containing protein [bacterium]|nr:VWA domain-containing protein [candidate division CSSED10-310 bacterium]
MRRSFLIIGGIGLALLMSALPCPAAEPDGFNPGYVDHNVVIVLDASGSMNTKMHSGDMTRMQAAKNAILDVLRQIPGNTQVGILVFSARNVQADWIYPLGPVDVDRLIEVVNRPYPGGSTPLGKYIKKGADALLARRAEQFGYGTYRLIVVTDGEAGDQNLVDRYIPDVLSRGIIVDAIGLDMKQDHTLATRVNSYRRADDPHALTLALESVFAEIDSDVSDGTPDEAFEEIAALPDDIAWAMLTALSSGGNQPIGEPPGASPAESSASTSSFENGAAGPSASSTATPASSKSSTNGRFNVLKTLVILVIALILVASKGLKRK